MNKTGDEIEADVYSIIQASSLKNIVKGSIYKSGQRPPNAKTEDAVVSFLTGREGDIQTGVVLVNIYVPDIDSGAGNITKDIARCRELGIAANQFIQGIESSEYWFYLDSTIQTFKAEETGQHFVNARIRFHYLTL